MRAKNLDRACQLYLELDGCYDHCSEEVKTYFNSMLNGKTASDCRSRQRDSRFQTNERDSRFKTNGAQKLASSVMCLTFLLALGKLAF